MGRTPDPNRKPELLGRIMRHVATEPLSRMTFRSLANSLGVSTYSFVYHFGSRQEMIDAILAEGVRQQYSDHASFDVAEFDREQFADWYREVFRRSISDDNRTVLRLQFEAGALEPVDPDIGTRITESYIRWRDTVEAWLTGQGVEVERARILSHWLVDTATGLHFGYLISGDRDTTVGAFDVFVAAFIREAFAA
ncbi:TetR/AcrR family transcriptional regulator [Leifsonia sp. NPDC058292]|uniref:TetR/AcrR family transcriptional regulator n=1 Tax=Leifsonia sp. NPDC058292 TaxID=3346428 RepID=UPI0036D84296